MTTPKRFPAFSLFKEFLDEASHQTILEYVSNDREFSELKDSFYETRFELISHSKKPELVYLRPYVAVDGKISDSDYLPEPSSWLYLRNYPSDIEILQAIDKIDKQVQNTIKELFGLSVKGVYAPFLLKFSDGCGLRLHTDTFKEDEITDYKNISYFSSTYYINDDFVGGENFFPYYGTKLQPRANSLYLTTDINNEDMIHEIKPVASGARYTRQQLWQLDSEA
jgi:hypothetical protein